MVAYRADELVSSSDFAKKFGSYLKMIHDNSVDKLAILKNNKVEAVLVSKEEYEMMSTVLKQAEAVEFLESIKNGLKDIELGNTKPIDELWEELDG